MIFRKKQKFTTEELLRLLDALIAAPTSTDKQVSDQFNYISSKYKTLDKIPYDHGMKLIELFERTKQTPRNKDVN